MIPASHQLQLTDQATARAGPTMQRQRLDEAANQGLIVLASPFRILHMNRRAFHLLCRESVPPDTSQLSLTQPQTYLLPGSLERVCLDRCRVLWDLFAEGRQGLQEIRFRALSPNGPLRIRALGYSMHPDHDDNRIVVLIDASDGQVPLGPSEYE